MRMPQSGYTLCMKKTMRYMALLALWVLVGAGARAEEMVVTADGFRRAAQGPNGTVLLLEQDVRLQDGIAVRVDALAALIDKNSERVWETVLGGDGEDALYQAISLPQGGWMAAGLSGSADLDNGWHEGWYSDMSAKTDGWAVRLSALGEVVWSRCFGGSDWDSLRGLCAAVDTGWVLAGETYSSDGDVEGWHDSGALNVLPDGWLVCVNLDGDILWQRALGGSGADTLQAICALEDGYLAAGSSSSADGDVQSARAETDGWLVRLDARGEAVWSRCFGADGRSSAFRALAAGPQGLWLAAGKQDADGWLVCVNAQGEALWEAAIPAEGDMAVDVPVWNDPVWTLAGRTLGTDETRTWVLSIQPQTGEWSVISGAL